MYYLSVKNNTIFTKFLIFYLQMIPPPFFSTCYVVSFLTSSYSLLYFFLYKQIETLLLFIYHFSFRLLIEIHIHVRPILQTSQIKHSSLKYKKKNNFNSLPFKRNSKILCPFYSLIINNTYERTRRSY